jgi:glycosyltransferase involved in cell wall biosynthesis
LVRHFSWGDKTIRWLDSLRPRPDAVLLFGGYVPYMARLVPWCRRNSTALLVDVVEWYQPSHQRGGVFGPFNLNTELALRWYYPKADGVVAISRFLQRHFEACGCRTIRIPPTLDVRATVPRLQSGKGETLTLVYAGVPGKKDLLGNVLEAVLRVDPAGRRVRLVVAGPRTESLLDLPQVKGRLRGRLPDHIQALGRVSHDVVTDLVRGADFVPLLRPPLRYAQAGFPTKVVESLAVGTPVICNLTSDLSEYVHDGKEGILCPDFTAEACSAALERALALSPTELTQMRRAARSAAERWFDFRSYTEELAAFMDDTTRRLQGQKSNAESERALF